MSSNEPAINLSNYPIKQEEIEDLVNLPLLVEDQTTKQQISTSMQESIEGGGAAKVFEPISDYQQTIHRAELNNLLHYYGTEIVNQIKRLRYNTKVTRQQHLDALEKKTCPKVCNHVQFSYADSAVYRHSTFHYFGKRLMELDYRYCRDCRRLMPKALILEREDRKDPSLKQRRKESTPIRCPCCNRRTALAHVLIRKTKMARFLFKNEGYD